MVDISKGKMVVVKHNDLIHAAQKMTLMEYRIILSCIAQVNSTGAITPDDLFTLHISDLENYIDDGTELRYNDLKDAVDKLAERWVLFLKPSVRSRKPIETKVRWVSTITYLPSEGRIILGFSYHILPFISELTKEFTKYKLEYVMQFKCSYSFDFYELFKSSMSSESILTLEWIKDKFQLDDKYNRTDNLQNRVIKPAITEINKYSDVNVDFVPVREGRKITAFKFTFVCLEDKKSKTKSKPRFNQDRIDGILKTDLEKYAKPGESYSQAATRLKMEQMMLEKNGKEKTLDVKW